MKVEEYDDLVKQRFSLSLEVAKAERDYGVNDPRYLEAVDAYNIAASHVDSLRAMKAKGRLS